MGDAATATTLWGRQRETELVDGLVDPSGSDVDGLVVVGEPGIGKSSLWLRGVVSASRSGFQVLATTCVEAESEMPYAGLEDLFGGLLDEQGAVLPAPQRDALDGAFLRRSTDAEADSRTVAAGVLTLLRRALAAGPVLLAVDDLHWVDAETHTCLAYALRRLDDPRLRLLIATRDQSPLWRPAREDTDDAFLTAIANRTQTLRLGPLPGEAIRRMLHDRRGVDLSPEESRHIALETGGNPFWALEFGRGRRGAATGGRPPALSRLVADRIADLEPEVVDAACLVAALGRPRPGTVLPTISNWADGEDGPTGGRRSSAHGEQLLDLAATAGLLTMSGERLTTAHPLIGAALLAFLPPFRRRRVHRRAADLAETPEARALHLSEAAGFGTEDPTRDGAGGHGADRAELLEALDRAVSAARDRGALTTAARFAMRALALGERGVPREGHVDGASASALGARIVDTAELQYQAGDLGAVLATLEHRDLGILDDDLLERAAPLLAQTVNEKRGVLAARDVVASFEALPCGGAPGRRQALISTLRSDLKCGAVGDRRIAAAAAVEQAESSSARLSLRRRAMWTLAYALLDAGDPVGDVRQRLEDLGPPDARELGGFDIELFTGMSRWRAGDLVGARAVFAAILERHLVTGDAPAIAHAGAMQAHAELVAGALPDAERTLGLLDEHLDRRSGEWPYVLVARGDLHLARGEHDAVDALLAEQGEGGFRSSRSLAFAERLRGVLARQRGQTAQAVVHLERFAALCEDHGFLDPLRRLDVDAHLAEALIAVGDHARAEQVISRLAGSTCSATLPVVRGQHRRLLAQLAAWRDAALERAGSLAREAVDLHEDGPFLVEYGRSLLTLAEICRASGSSSAASEYGRRAHALFTDIGHVWWADHSSGDAPRTATASDLGAGERAVADLVASGATNRETAAALHLSVRTVENHLHNVYRKLGIGSRHELGAHLPR